MEDYRRIASEASDLCCLQEAEALHAVSIAESP